MDTRMVMYNFCERNTLYVVTELTGEKWYRNRQFSFYTELHS
jgi:hypothetical protein